MKFLLYGFYWYLIIMILYIVLSQLGFYLEEKKKEQEQNVRDGRNEFFRNLSLEKNDKKLLSNYITIKNDMLREKVEEYSNGKISKTE